MTETRRIKSSPVAEGFVELPQGIFTVDGIWYHTSLKDLQDFAPEIVKHIGAFQLFEKASDWARLPSTVVAWMMPLVLLVVPGWSAVLLGIVVFWVASLTLPSLVVYSAIPAVRILNHPFSQGFFYVAFVSFFAAQGAFTAVWIGLISFVALRWQLLSRVFEATIQKRNSGPTKLEFHDRILRNVLIAASIKYGASHPEIDRMEKRMIEIATRHKRKK